jgi:anaerobic carbon-monoxide dehydrogenase, CODH/ACS complex subunit epsilon
MVMKPVPWQTGEICGPDAARALTKPEILKRDLSKCKKRLLVVGSEAVTLKHGKGDMIDYAIALSKAGNMDIIATGGAIKAFVERGFDRAKSMGAMDLAFRLQKPDWVGPFGKGPYNMLMIFGQPYYMQWTLLSSVMNFGTHITAIAIGRYFQPHAKWSFPNMKEKPYHVILDGLLEFVGGSK